MSGTQEARLFKQRLTIDAHTRYLLYLPDDYGREDRKWPVVMFLHGMGERGSDLELVKRHGPPKLIAAGKKFPFIVISPQCPDDEMWSVPVLKALLDRVLDMLNVDRSRVYLTGLSMGGNATWRLAAAHPGMFAAIVPVCGWGEPGKVAAIKGIPAWVFHGKKDQLVPIARGEAMVKGLQEAGGNVRFTVYPEAGHDSWTETYENPQLYEWMMEQVASGAP